MEGSYIDMKNEIQLANEYFEISGVSMATEIFYGNF